ncbi:ECF transporter S component [Bacillus methanolicus]|uniref:ECF transporter S component n=1 Tax=Bacillus methanolicus TaxID=1471 RepID=UPI0023803AFB|nr:ECF transporter S component [Bacillus methanolicus]MDE3840698.1 ECF transporter S component [Bacillus methanolicus]
MFGRKIVLAALFTALSVVGASIKIPAVIGSIALDSFPALLASVLLGNGAGAVIAASGHILSALLGGMPLGPLHFLVALEMAVLVWIFGNIYRTGSKKMAGFIFLFSNAFLAPLPFLFIMGKEFFFAILPSLFIGSLFNLAAALLMAPRLVWLKGGKTDSLEANR